MLALLFFVVPIIEIFLFIQVGEEIGAWWTIFCVIATAVIGAFLLRQQGMSTLARFQKNMASGVVPAKELLEGIALLIGGALLMTPGFFTDTFGFLCLLPFSRGFIIDKLLSKVSFSATSFGAGFGSRSSEQGDTIDGEYTRKPDEFIGKS
ncbi:FxsA family protein [Leucothrix sargassi]|nr:FxsA family protein [Leucothrix sargassi]